VPELPDITIYLEALERRIVGQTLNRVRVASPFLLRTAVPPLTDPNLFSGIGNAYSDEILYAAQLSPVALTQRLLPTEIERLHRATLATLQRWIELLRQETGDAFPEKVTAFRPQMAVHGKFGQPCPTCGAKVQRIRYADNETNYCPGCQTETLGRPSRRDERR
jgi:formamidopyrimidine-DNA glycosylase